MDEKLRAAYDVYKDKLQKLLVDVSNTKKILNQIAIDMGERPEFEDVEVEHIGTTIVEVKPGMFYNRPLAGSVREYMEMVEQARGRQGVDVNEIFEALRRGGYSDLKTKVDEEKVRLSLLKNTTTFALVGKDHFGLREWYGKKDKTKVKKKPLPKPKRKAEKTKDGDKSDQVQKPETENPKQ